MPRTSGSPFPFVRAAVAAGLLAVTACSSAGASRGDGEVEVAAALYPYQFVAERVGGEHVRVRNLTAAGGEPHDLELSPRQVAELGDADLVVFSAGFQPAVDEAVEQQAPDHALDVLSAVDLRTGAGHDDAGHSDAGHDDAGHDDAGHDDPGTGRATTRERPIPTSGSIRSAWPPSVPPSPTGWPRSTPSTPPTTRRVRPS